MNLTRRRDLLSRVVGLEINQASLHITYVSMLHQMDSMPMAKLWP